MEGREAIGASGSLARRSPSFGSHYLKDELLNLPSLNLGLLSLLLTLTVGPQHLSHFLIPAPLTFHQNETMSHAFVIYF